MMSDSTDVVRLTLVGCGKAKREITGNPQYSDNHYVAAELYTSHYFRLKREYAERMSTYWQVLSAKHGLYHPYCTLKPYDVALTRDGFTGNDEPLFDSVDEWATHVIDQLNEDLDYYKESSGNQAVDEIVLLAGQAYVNPLRVGLATITADHDLDVRFPFDDTSGLPDQITWLQNNTDQNAPVGVRYASYFEDELQEAAQ